MTVVTRTVREGDPTYLRLLDGLTPYFFPSFNALDMSWRQMVRVSKTNTPLYAQLLDLARHSFTLVAVETGRPFSEVIDRARSMHVEKNSGYAGADNPDPWANFRMATAFGLTPLQGVLVRMSDKYIRTVNLRRRPANEQVGESLTDTLFDLGAYALIAICLINEERTHE